MKKVFTLLLSLSMLLVFNSVTFASDVGKFKVPKTECAVQSHIDINTAVINSVCMTNDVSANESHTVCEPVITSEFLFVENVNILKAPALYWCCNSNETFSTTKLPKGNKHFEKTAAWVSLGISRRCIIEKKA